MTTGHDILGSSNGVHHPHKIGFQVDASLGDTELRSEMRQTWPLTRLEPLIRLRLTPSAYIVKSVRKRDNLEPNIHTALPILTTCSHALGNTERHPDTIESSAAGI
jgi:hypothetical protein